MLQYYQGQLAPYLRTIPFRPQPNADDDNESSEYQEEDVQVHDLTSSRDMEKLANVLQNRNVGPSVVIFKFSGKTQDLITAWIQNYFLVALAND